MSLVMVVDDEAAIRELLKEIFEDEGLMVILAEDGQQALDLLATVSPVVVLTDIMMPRVDGISLLVQLKANLPTRHIPVILMTAGQHGGYEQLGATAVLHKPLDLDSLVALVGQYT